MTIPAGMQSPYTIDINLSYSGSCNTSNGQVEYFNPVSCLSNGISLSWNAPSDSGCHVLAYDVRYSSSAITEGNWSSATQLTGEPTPGSGVIENFTASGLSACTLYYFGIKSQRQDGSYSPLVASVCARTLCEGSSECQICE